MTSKHFVGIQAVGPQGPGMILVLILVLLNPTNLKHNQYISTQIKLNHNQHTNHTHPQINIPIHYHILQIPQQPTITLLFLVLIDLW